MTALVLLYDVLRILHCPFLPDGIGDVATLTELIALIRSRGNVNMEGHSFVETKSNAGFVWTMSDGDVAVVLRNRTPQLIIVTIQFDGNNFVVLQLPTTNVPVASAQLYEPKLNWLERFNWVRRFGQYDQALRARLVKYTNQRVQGE